jgi:Zn-finger nucleic acid-binding protein
MHPMIKTVTVRTCDLPSCRRELKEGETLHHIQFQGLQLDACSDCVKHFEWLEKELDEFIHGSHVPHTVQVHVQPSPHHSRELEAVIKRANEDARLGSWLNY